MVNAVVPHAVAVKPQLAFFELLGADGLAAFAETCAYARSAGTTTLTVGRAPSTATLSVASATVASCACRQFKLAKAVGTIRNHAIPDITARHFIRTGDAAGTGKFRYGRRARQNWCLLGAFVFPNLPLLFLGQ